MKLKLFALLVSLFCIKISYAQYTDLINSNRPGESFSAFAVGKTVLQIESGVNYLHEKHSLLNYKSNGFGLDFNVRYGFFREQLEVLMDIKYQKDTYTTAYESTKRTGINGTTIGAKYLVYDPFKNYEKKVNIHSWKANHKFSWHEFIPAIAVYGGANLNFSNNPFISELEKESKFSPKAMLITHNVFGSGYVFVTNIFMDKIGTDYQSLEYIVTLTKGFNEKWSGFIENKGIKGDYYSDAILRGGAAYLLNTNLQVDASVSANFKNTPTVLYGGIGVSWRYDANYNEIMLRKIKKEKKKDNSSKGKNKDKNKDKNKTKKRLDQVETPKP